MKIHLRLPICSFCSLDPHPFRSLLTPSFLDRTIRAAVQQHLFEINPLHCPGVPGPGLRRPGLLDTGLPEPGLHGPNFTFDQEFDQETKSTPCFSPPSLASARQRRRQKREQREEEEGKWEPERSRYGSPLVVSAVGSFWCSNGIMWVLSSEVSV